MPKRPTIKELATAANVGVASVDRALNGRSNVRPEVLDKVCDAAERIGYPTRILTARRVEMARPMVRFGFVLHKGAQEFYQNFARALKQAVDDRADICGRATIRFAASQEGAIAALRETRPPGKIALVVNELTADSRKALINRNVGMAIATPLRQLCQDLVDQMITAALDRPDTSSGQHFLTSTLYVPESF
jgi:DNA-binding LacI/PurR family transcriptional regulator